MVLDPKRVAGELEARLRALGTRERAEHERRYLKSELEHLGASVWQIRREGRSLVSERLELSHAELIALVEALWAKLVFELAGDVLGELLVRHPRSAHRPSLRRDQARGGQVPGTGAAHRADSVI